MNTSIDIHDNNTNETGSYKVWYYHPIMGGKAVKILSESEINGLLNMRQKERFFMGKHKFKIDSEFDFKRTFFNQP